MAAENKRSHVEVSSDAESSANPDQKFKKARRRVSLATFDKWKRQYDDEYHTLRWLQCDKDATDYTVTLLWCEVCRKYSDQIRTKRNYSPAWVNGTPNHRNSNIVDHAKSEQHATAMARLRADTGELAEEEKVVFVVENAAMLASFPILDGKEMEKVKRKVQICYVMAREGLQFQKYTALHNLQELHGVDLGPLYRSSEDAEIFTHWIATSQRQLFQANFIEKHYFSFLLHHEASAEGKECTVLFVQYLVRNDVTKEISCCCRYLSVINLTDAYESEMVTCLGVSLGRLGVNILSKDEISDAKNRPTLVGGSTDRANNKDDLDMKTELQSAFPWLFWSWCFPCQLEVTCEKAFTSSLHKEINDLLVHLYSLCNKSPQRTHQFASIVEDLKEVFHFSDVGGSFPVHNQGTHWINHKRRALQRILDRFGVYCAHLHSMANDSSLETTDQAKLKSFHQRWTQGKILIGCALYVDVLKAPSLLSLSLQENETDRISGIKHILNTMEILQLLKNTNACEWPTVTTVLAAIVEEENSKSYQGVALADFTSSTVSQCSGMALEDLYTLDDNLKDWLVWSDTKLLDAILSFLDTRRWAAVKINASGNADVSNGVGYNGETAAKSRPDNKKVTEIKDAVTYIVAIFREPLEVKGADLCSINDELEEMFTFCSCYVDVLAEDYNKIWYKLFTAHDSHKWCNVLLISELLFSLPFASSKVERTLTKLNLVKAEHRHMLTSGILDDLMEINIEGPPIDSFTADHAMQLWWTNHAQKPTEESSDNSNSESLQNTANAEFSLSDWNDVSINAISITNEANNH